MRKHRCTNGEVSRRALYRYLLRYKETHGGASPSVQEIMRDVGFASASTVTHHLRVLAADGRIQLVTDDGRKYRQSRHIAIPGERWIAPETADPQQEG